MEQTKAQRLFHKNFAACLRHIEHWGFEGAAALPAPATIGPVDGLAVEVVETVVVCGVVEPTTGPVDGLAVEVVETVVVTGTVVPAIFCVVTVSVVVVSSSVVKTLVAVVVTVSSVTIPF